MGSTGAAAKFGQNAAPENEMTAGNPYNMCCMKTNTYVDNVYDILEIQAVFSTTLIL